MVYLRRTRRPNCQGRHAPLRPFRTEGSAESSGSTRPAARSSSGTERGGGGLPPPSHFLFFGFFEPRHDQWPAPPTYFVELPPPRGGRIASCCPLPVMWYMVAGPAANHNPTGDFFGGIFHAPHARTRAHPHPHPHAPAHAPTRAHTGRKRAMPAPVGAGRPSVTPWRTACATIRGFRHPTESHGFRICRSSTPTPPTRGSPCHRPTRRT